MSVNFVSLQTVMTEYLKEMGLRASTTTRAPTSALIATRPHRTSPSGGNGLICILIGFSIIFRHDNHPIGNSTARINACPNWRPTANRTAWHSANWSARNHRRARPEHRFASNIRYWLQFGNVGAPGVRTTVAGGEETTAAGVEGYFYYFETKLKLKSQMKWTLVHGTIDWNQCRTGRILEKRLRLLLKKEQKRRLRKKKVGFVRLYPFFIIHCARTNQKIIAENFEDSSIVNSTCSWQKNCSDDTDPRPWYHRLKPIQRTIEEPATPMWLQFLDLAW